MKQITPEKQQPLWDFTLTLGEKMVFAASFALNPDVETAYKRVMKLRAALDPDFDEFDADSNTNEILAMVEAMVERERED